MVLFEEYLIFGVLYSSW